MNALQLPSTDPWGACFMDNSVSRWQATWPVTVVEVATRRDRNRFLRLPRLVGHADDGPVSEIKRLLTSRRHPFYRRGEAAAFLATSDGQPVGRILALDDQVYNTTHGANRGWIGLFASIDDDHTAGVLLDAAADWLAARGRPEIAGPIDGSMHDPPYYRRLFANWGLVRRGSARCKSLAA